MLQRLGLPDEHVVDGRARRPRPRRRTRPPHVACSSTPASSRSRPELARLVALAERLRGPGGCPWDAEADAPLAAPPRARRGVRGGGGDRRAPGRRARAATSTLGAYDALEDELGDLLFQVDDPVGARGRGRRVHRRRRRAAHPRQARAPPPARVRRRARSAAPTRSSPTGSRSRRPRRATSRSSRASRPGSRRCSRCRSCCARPTRSALDPELDGARPRRRRGGRARAGHDRGGRQSARHRRGVRARRMGAPIPGAVPTHGGTRRERRHRSRGSRRGVHPSAVERGVTTPVRSAPWSA